MADHKKHDLDFDALLHGYSDVEPPPGLETRILANVRQGRRRSAWHFRLLFAGSAATALAVLILLVWRDSLHSRPQPIESSNHTQPPSPAVLQHPSGATVAVRRQLPAPVRPHPRVVAAQLPMKWPAVFPTPRPLSDQEKLLLQYIARTPREEVLAQSRPEEPPPVFPDNQSALPVSGSQQGINTK